MREHFLLDPAVIFLNHGSFGATPREVLQAQQRWQAEMEANPVEFLGRRSGELLAGARAALGAYLGATPDDLAFVPNATTGVNTVARSLNLQPGDEVLTTDHEYGACDATWRWVCERTGAVYRRVEIPLPFAASEFASRLLAAVTPRTKLMFLSHITSTTALIFPIRDICEAARSRGILTLIDGAHAPGQIDLHLEALGADFYTGNGHKWMCGPKGSAFLYARPEHHALLQAPVVSWGYVAEGLGGHSGFDAYTGSGTLQRRLQWQGTRDMSAWLALPAAIEFQQRHNGSAVRTRCRAQALGALHTLRARWGLDAIARDSDLGQMVAIPVPHQDAETLRRRLFQENRIEVPVTQHAGQTFVRISVPCYTTQTEIEALMNAPVWADRP
jgi:isopenicillin-N epimerase